MPDERLRDALSADIGENSGVERGSTIGDGAETVVRRAYEAYVGGDLDGMLELVDPDLEWTFLDPAFIDPEPRVLPRTARAGTRPATAGVARPALGARRGAGRGGARPGCDPNPGRRGLPGGREGRPGLRRDHRARRPHRGHTGMPGPRRGARVPARLSGVDFALTEQQEHIRDAVRELCAAFPESYWQRLDAAEEYPAEFVQRLTEQGWLSILIPEEFGGGGLGVTEASIVLEEIHRSGGNAAACHAQMYTMGTLLRHGSDELQRRTLPAARGRIGCDCRGSASPNRTPGSDTPAHHHAGRAADGDRWVINGQKTFISRVEHTDLLLLLARTTPLDRVERRTDGMSVFLVDLREAGGAALHRRIPLMFNHHTYELFVTDLEVPRSNLVGEEGQGFRLHHQRHGTPNASCSRRRRSATGGTSSTGHRRTLHSARCSAGRSARTRACSSRSPRRTRPWRRRRWCGSRRRRCSTPGGSAAPRPTWPSSSPPRPRGRPRTRRDGLRRERVRPGVRHRAQVPRDQAAGDRAGQQQPRARVPRAPRAGDAEVLPTTRPGRSRHGRSAPPGRTGPDAAAPTIRAMDPRSVHRFADWIAIHERPYLKQLQRIVDAVRPDDPPD